MDNLGLFALAWVALLAWLYLAVFHWKFWRSDRFLPAVTGAVKKWPSVVAIIPARNEEKILGQTLKSVADQDYPGAFRVIVVNDSSIDNTARVAKKVKGKASVEILDAKPLEEGWAGKLWAMNSGVEGAGKKAKADYIWFTDADICHEPDVLRGLVAAAVLDNRTMVSQMVKLHCESFWEQVLVPAFIFFFQLLYPFGAINSDKSKRAGAAGGCILIEQATLAKIGGLGAIKDALIDDCALAGTVKGAGGRIWLGFGMKSRSIRPHTFSDFWATVVRTAFTQLQYSWVLLVAAILGLVLILLVPLFLFVMGLVGGNPVLSVVGGCGWMVGVVLYWPTLRLYRLDAAYGVLLPLAGILYMLMTIDSALRHIGGTGGRWKERSYDF